MTFVARVSSLSDPSFTTNHNCRAFAGSWHKGGTDSDRSHNSITNLLSNPYNLASTLLVGSPLRQSWPSFHCSKNLWKTSDANSEAQNHPFDSNFFAPFPYLPFWGDVGIKKWSRFFCLGTRSAIFWHLKMGTFAKSARFQVTKNSTSGAETKKRRPLFHANIPPKWYTTRLFYAFSTFGWVLSQFWKIVYLEPFRSRFYC